MNNIIKNFINKNNYNIKGFMGTTHILISILCLFLLLLFPNILTEDYLKNIRSDYILFIIIFFVICGASLLPDLDGDHSTAGYRLGLFGKLITIIMKITSSIVWEFTNMKNDKRPKTQHRLLWHTIFISIFIMLLLWFGIPNLEISYLNIIKEKFNSGGIKNLLIYLSEDFLLFLTIFLIIISLYLGFNAVTWRIFKLIPWDPIKRFGPSLIQSILIFIILIFPINNLKYISISVGIGYLFHNIGDLFSLGSIPLIYPIPAFWKKQWWWKPRLPFQIATGGLANKILDIFLLAINIILFWIIFI